VREVWEVEVSGCSYVSSWLVVFDLSMIDFLLFDYFFRVCDCDFCDRDLYCESANGVRVSTDKLERSQVWKTTEDRELESATMRDRHERPQAGKVGHKRPANWKERS